MALKQRPRITGIDGRNGLVSDYPIQFKPTIKEPIQNLLNATTAPVITIDTPVENDFLQSPVFNGFYAICMVKSMSIKLLYRLHQPELDTDYYKVALLTL